MRATSNLKHQSSNNERNFPSQNAKLRSPTVEPQEVSHLIASVPSARHGLDYQSEIPRPLAPTVGRWTMAEDLKRPARYAVSEFCTNL